MPSLPSHSAKRSPDPRRPAGPRGRVEIRTEECKGCGLCVDACPPHCLELAAELSAYGVHPAEYLGDGCTGCGICFYMCPEPGAISVYRFAPPPAGAGKGEAHHAATL